MMRKLALAAVAAAAWFGCAGAASAWSEPGHRTVGALAYLHLTPKAKQAVGAIIATNGAVGETQCPINALEDAAEFPDCVKFYPALSAKYQFMREWHFDDFSQCGVMRPMTDYCPNGGCATEAIKRAFATLQNPQAAAKDRLLALAQLSHFVGDIHQPLHTADHGDTGGNDIKTTYLGQTHRDPGLHHAWDADLVAAAVGSKDQAVKKLDAEIPAGPSPSVDVAAVDGWAMDSYHLAIDHAYKDLGYTPACHPNGVYAIDQNYINSETPIVHAQLVLAAERLAGLLNAAFG